MKIIDEIMPKIKAEVRLDKDNQTLWIKADTLDGYGRIIIEDGDNWCRIFYDGCDDCPRDGKIVNDSEFPNNCETCANGESDIEACGYCRHGDLYEPKDEPQTCSVNGRPYDCGNCEYFRCTADEPQTGRRSK